MYKEEDLQGSWENGATGDYRVKQCTVQEILKPTKNDNQKYDNKSLCKNRRLSEK